MTPEQQAAFVFSQSISALIEAMGMFSHNSKMTEKHFRDGVVFYQEWQFNALIEKYGIHSNAVIGLFHDL